MWYRRIKLMLLVVAAISIFVRGATYNDPTGYGIVPIVMCALMGFSLLLLTICLATNSRDPLFI